MCFHRACDSHRKSIPRHAIEGDFEAPLHDLTPTRRMFNLMTEIIEADLQIEQLVDRIVNSVSTTAIAAYETRIAKPERAKLIAPEKLSRRPGSQRALGEMFELAMAFLSNPWKPWASERLDDKRTALKLVFQSRLEYHREQRVRTAKTTLSFNTLGGMTMHESEMARPKG